MCLGANQGCKVTGRQVQSLGVPLSPFISTNPPNPASEKMVENHSQTSWQVSTEHPRVPSPLPSCLPLGSGGRFCPLPSQRVTSPRDSEASGSQAMRTLSRKSENETSPTFSSSAPMLCPLTLLFLLFINIPLLHLDTSYCLGGTARTSTLPRGPS